MNFLAHGYRYLDRPYFLAGTAVPDWLVVADRSLRLRAERLEAFLQLEDGHLGELARGMLQHLRDDAWFHSNPVFVRLSAELTREIAAWLGKEDSFRPAFLGHLITELLLDAALAREDVGRITAYYRSVASLELAQLEAMVGRICGRPTDRLAPMIRRFLAAQVLWDYLDDRALVRRVNQVLRRVGFAPVPDGFSVLLLGARKTVELHREALLAGIPAMLPAACCPASQGEVGSD
jgi:hypothetical protein